jgi:hypothetical protein
VGEARVVPCTGLPAEVQALLSWTQLNY